MIILESYHESQLGLKSGGPQDINMLFSEKEVIEDFEALDCKFLDVCS